LRRKFIRIEETPYSNLSYGHGGNNTRKNRRTPHQKQEKTKENTNKTQIIPT
jgi:hypothetical protein